MRKNAKTQIAIIAIITANAMPIILPDEVGVGLVALAADVALEEAVVLDEATKVGDWIREVARTEGEVEGEVEEGEVEEGEVEEGKVEEGEVEEGKVEEGGVVSVERASDVMGT